MRGATAFVVVGRFAGVAAAEPVTWRVVIIRDGDTLTCLDAENVEQKIRLQGIDAP